MDILAPRNNPQLLVFPVLREVLFGFDVVRSQDVQETRAIIQSGLQCNVLDCAIERVARLEWFVAAVDCVAERRFHSLSVTGGAAHVQKLGKRQPRLSGSISYSLQMFHRTSCL